MEGVQLVIMSYHGWNGKDDSHAGGKLVSALIALKYAEVSKDLIIQLNDSGATFDEIADSRLSGQKWNDIS
ncbi:MAG: hypothetical protein ACRD5E_06165 [Nitrososphaeraceae archaeon]